MERGDSWRGGSRCGDVLGAGLLLKIGGQTVETDLEGARLPSVAVEHINCTACILGGGEQDGAIAARAVVRPEGDVCAEDSAGLAEKIFEVLPADAVRELQGQGKRWSQERATGRLTLPTKSCVRVSLPGRGPPGGLGREDVACLMTASMSSSEGCEARSLTGGEDMVVERER